MLLAAAASQMIIARYLTHPQVLIEPEVPVTDWGLSELGRTRAGALAAAPWLHGIRRIVASYETKAVQTALAVAAIVGIDIEVHIGMGENDRSSTGFLPAPEFEATADQFFAEPDRSVRGWATARAEQARIVAAIAAVLRKHGDDGDILFVGHGAVGTLNLCHLLGVPIARTQDQPADGGNVYAWQPDSGRVLHHWRSIEDEIGELENRHSEAKLVDR